MSRMSLLMPDREVFAKVCYTTAITIAPAVGYTVCPSLLLHLPCGSKPSYIWTRQGVDGNKHHVSTEDGWEDGRRMFVFVGKCILAGGRERVGVDRK